MEGKELIYEKIAAVQADVDFIGKDKQVQSGGSYKYRGVDQVLNALHPLFAKHKIFAVPEVLDVLAREARETKNGGNMLYQVLKVKYTFYAEDGSNVSAVVVGEAMDGGDKASNKCMSVAYKYACFQILSIPTEETTADPDEENEAFAPASRKLTNAELEEMGFTDISAMVAWIEKRAGKRMGELTGKESEAIRTVLKKKQAERAQNAGYAKQIAEADGEAPF